MNSQICIKSANYNLIHALRLPLIWQMCQISDFLYNNRVVNLIGRTKVPLEVSTCYRSVCLCDYKIHDKNPIRGIFFGCCDWAGKQSAKSMAKKARPKTLVF